MENIKKASSVVLIAASSCLLLVTIFGDVSEATTSLLFRTQPRAVVWFSIVATIIGCVFPLVLLLWIIVREMRGKALRRKDPGFNFAGSKKRWLFHWHWILLPAIVGCFYWFYVVERDLEPVTIMPFSTAISTSLFIVVAFWLLRGSTGRSRVTVVSVYALLILSTRFLDWNSRKPFLRDLLPIRHGMTVEQVKGLMGGYMSDQDADEESNPNVTLFYSHSENARYNMDWGKITMRDGKVVAIYFSRD